ncbi:MAG: transcription-repair coupling factor [Armatimonadota bacterium]|nr:transcription-repair coupling factor [Armatimonadota bacterium]MDR7601135.1 transcription-repair coupling factor [Armatimonadota bacterium]
MWITGPMGAQKALVLVGYVRGEVFESGSCVLLLAPGREAVDRLADDLGSFAPELEPFLRPLPPLEGEEGGPQSVGERLRALRDLVEGRPAVLLVPVRAAVAPVPSPERLRASLVRLREGERLPLEAIAGFCAAGGYERVGLVERPGTFAVRGGILDVYPPDAERPLRVEWFGEVVESIRCFDPQTQRSERKLPSVEIPSAREPGGETCLVDLLPEGSLVILDEPPELEHRAAGGVFEWERIRRRLLCLRAVAISGFAAGPPDWPGVRLEFGSVDPFAGQVGMLARELERWRQAGYRVVVASTQAHRLAEILTDQGFPADTAEDLVQVPEAGRAVVVSASLSNGFRIEDLRLVVVTDAEVLGWRRRRRRFHRAKEGALLRSWTDLHPGDLVVHVHHGIGRFRGMVRKTVDGVTRDYLHLEYAEGDALYVPTDQVNLVQRYVGVEGIEPKIHRLGTADWEREKRRVREATQQIARELLELYARRETVRGHTFSPDTPWQREMEAAFEYEETPDQRKAIEDVKRDMESPRPMDRLVAGDVGYGKTEVAVRAAFKAVMDGKQVAVLAPTTLLAQQHYHVFSSRFRPYPIRVELLSRFRPKKEIQAVLEALASGEVDVVIGTHRLLQKDVRFHDLGLVIIDEEQRFGVVHKEKLKQLRASVDVLTLTATPIPRTLHMALVGLRDLSVMETPPEARLPIRTTVAEWDETLVQNAIRRELERGGQVYVVHNRVQTIQQAARRIQALVPEARVGVAHGQMAEGKLERVMLDFLGGKYDVLVCTTIIEIGLDLPNVNTLLVEDAHTLGLAQLYQLRGRVGRSDRQAYAYFLYPRGARLTSEARERLAALREFTELGSGLRLAMRDLEIRGAGNLLGPEQHGHLAAVGFELYTCLLEEAIRRLRGEFVEEVPDPVVDLRVSAYLPAGYIPEEAQRLSVYRRLAALRSTDEATELREELRDRYGPLPEPVHNLVEIAALRERARGLGIGAVVQRPDGVLLRFRIPLEGREKDWLRLEYRRRVEIAPEGVLVRCAPEEALRWIREVLDSLTHLRRREPTGVPAR